MLIVVSAPWSSSFSSLARAKYFACCTHGLHSQDRLGEFTTFHNASHKYIYTEGAASTTTARFYQRHGFVAQKTRLVSSNMAPPGPIIPETVIDGPTQRLYFLSFCALVHVSVFARRLHIDTLINDLILIRCPFKSRYNVPRVPWTRTIGV